MSTLQIEERISLAAPPDRVWRFLLDPARVAACLPGARLDGTEGDRTYLGTMKVKVGPVLMEFKGKATMSEVLPDERRVTLSGTGNDKSGGGSARMDMKSQVLAKDGGGSEIVIVADVDLAGKLVRFGRGMMDGISKQLFKQFSERVRAALEGAHEEEPDEEQPAEQATTEAAPAPPAAATPAPPAEPSSAPTQASAALAAVLNTSPATPATAAPEATAPETAAPETAAPETAAEALPGPPDRVDDPAVAPKSGAEEAPATVISPSPADRPPSKKAALAPADNAPLDAGSLVWSALWAWIKGLFARIFGKKP